MLVAGGWLEKIAGAGSLLLLASGGWLRTVLLVHVGRLLGKGGQKGDTAMLGGWWLVGEELLVRDTEILYEEEILLLMVSISTLM